MKTAELLRILKKNGATLNRHGARHDQWVRNGKITTVPRHPTIKENTAKGILKALGIR